MEIFQRILFFLLSHFHELRDKLNILRLVFFEISNLEVILYWSPWLRHWNVLIPGITKICLLKKKKVVESVMIMMLCFIWVFQSKTANESQPFSKFGREVPLWGVRMCRAGWEIRSERGPLSLFTHWMGRAWLLRDLDFSFLSVQSKLETTSQTGSQLCWINS